MNSSKKKSQINYNVTSNYLSDKTKIFNKKLIGKKSINKLPNPNDNNFIKSNNTKINVIYHNSKKNESKSKKCLSFKKVFNTDKIKIYCRPKYKIKN